jgi:dihydrofolate synthase/folylpolyglutamate synthase
MYHSHESNMNLAAARGAALDWLKGRINYEHTAVPYQSRQLKLDRMRQLLTRLGQPDVGMKIFHVAGTKGKGSTSAMIAAMLTAAGYRTGFFSSPHLERIEERFMVDGQPCTSEELVTLIDRVKPVVRAMDEEESTDADSPSGPTYFEVTTAMALLHFVERQTDAVILEVGLGGRLDSTNICLPAVSVITSISFDHMRQLGNTLAAIAREKAGIIKPGVPVVCGVTDPEPQTVIAQIARDHGCRLIQLGRDFSCEYRSRQGDTETRRQGDQPTSLSLSPGLPVSLSGSITFELLIPSQELKLRDVQLQMHGPHQGTNAAVALATIAELRHQGWCISTDAMRIGLSRATLPGRVELVPGDPEVILDTAHNPASARALVAALAELPPAGRRTLIASISSDKDVRAVAAELVPHFERIIITQYQENPRAVPADTLTKIFTEAMTQAAPGTAGRSTQASSETPCQIEVLTTNTPREALQLAFGSAVRGERICIAGSFFLAAELRPLVLKSHAADVSEPVIR